MTTSGTAGGRKASDWADAPPTSNANAIASTSRERIGASCSATWYRAEAPRTSSKAGAPSTGATSSGSALGLLAQQLAQLERVLALQRVQHGAAELARVGLRVRIERLRAGPDLARARVPVRQHVGMLAGEPALGAAGPRLLLERGEGSDDDGEHGRLGEHDAGARVGVLGAGLLESGDLAVHAGGQAGQLLRLF